MNRSKAKGTAAETAIVNYLLEKGWIVERRTLSGNKDKGDLNISNCQWLVVEVKNCKQMSLSAWVAEAEVERINAAAEIGVVWHKRAGKGSPADWYVTMNGDNFLRFLDKAIGK